MNSSFTPISNPEDISTYSNFQEIRQKHIEMNATIDFESNKILFENTILFDILIPESQRIILDMKAVKIDSITSPLGKVEYSVYDSNPDESALGTPIIVSFPKTLEKTMTLTIKCETTDNSSSLKFLTKEQTLTKRFPFTFTQNEPILCRSLFPCQDSPCVKVTVTSRLTVKEGITALFSGILKETEAKKDSTTTFVYEQNVPIPTYLIAIAAGELEYGKLSERCGVWTEKGWLSAAMFDFAETEKFVETAENYLRLPYVWGIYNILVLPASFPYGGMENPCLTFVTPSLLTGDKSLANVIAHEISHSWTGNWVTNKNWENFWLNEGFTTFLQRKITEILFGEEQAILEKQLGDDSLNCAIKLIGEEHNFTSLAPNYAHCDPDDGFSSVPYEKGFAFLEYLERLTGKDKFRDILTAYLKKYEYKSVSYSDFKAVFDSVVNDTKITSQIDWVQWICSPGYPLVKPVYESKLIKEAEEMAKDLLDNKPDNNCWDRFIKWSTDQKLVCLNYIFKNIQKVTDNTYEKVKQSLKWKDSKYNTEVKNIWYQIMWKSKHCDCLEEMKNYWLSYGRMKYIKPIFFEWFKYDKKEAMEFFEKNKYLYHLIAVRLIEDHFNSQSMK